LEYTLKLNARKILKFTSLTVLGLGLVHLTARVVAGLTTLYNVHSPSETESSIFWMGFWQFDYTNERFSPAMNAIEPMDVITPHLIVLSVILVAVLVVFGIKFLIKATADQVSGISIAVSASAVTISVMSLLMRAMTI